MSFNNLITDESDKRLVLLSSIVAGVTALTLPVVAFLTYMGYIAPNEIPSGIQNLYYVSVSLSYIYILGPETYQEFKNSGE
jgi:hypothetical protein